MLRCALQLAALFLGGTVIRSEAADLVLTVLSAVFVLGVTLELYMGIMDAQAAAGLELRAPAAGWLMVWYILLYALGLLTAAGQHRWAAHARGVHRHPRLAGEAPKAARRGGLRPWRPRPVRLTDRRLGALLALAAAAAVALGLAFFSRYDMDWQPQPERGGEAAGAAEELLALGFPENVLADLADGDVLLCEGAAQVLSGTDTLSFRDGSELLTTGVAVLLPEFDGWEDYWLIFHHFEWQEGARLPGTDSAELWATSGWMLDRKNPAHGRLLYSEDGVTYTGAARRACCSAWDYQYTGGFGFSFPRGAEEARGYLCYGLIGSSDECVYLNSWLNYQHQTRALCIRRAPRWRLRAACSSAPASSCPTPAAIFSWAERALPELRRGRRGARQLKIPPGANASGGFFST